jgi:GTP cyclohydrolase I
LGLESIFEGYMAEIFAAFGMELETPATERTPQRFLKALYDGTAATRATTSC